MSPTLSALKTPQKMDFAQVSFILAIQYNENLSTDVAFFPLPIDNVHGRMIPF